MSINETFRHPPPAAPATWLGAMLRWLARAIAGMRKKNPQRWYDSDGAHRGL